MKHTHILGSKSLVSRILLGLMTLNIARNNRIHIIHHTKDTQKEFWSAMTMALSKLFPTTDNTLGITQLEKTSSIVSN